MPPPDPPPPKTSILIIGASRGLGLALAQQYSHQPRTNVYATSRSPQPPEGITERINWLLGVDITDRDCAGPFTETLRNTPIDVMIVSAGVFDTESFADLDAKKDWDKELRMYETSVLGPLFLVQQMAAKRLLKKGSKLIFVSSEAGSLTLRHQSEGGGNYGHHSSKAALNMTARLLSLDLKKEGVAVGLVHPGFMRTEMTRGVGFDKYWDQGGAVKPQEAAKSLRDFIEGFDIWLSGEFWAPRGTGDIGTWSDTVGKASEEPVRVPW